MIDDCSKLGARFREVPRIKLDVAPQSKIGNRQSKMGCGSNSVVESQPSKLLVAGSIPVSRSKKQWLVLSG